MNEARIVKYLFNNFIMKIKTIVKLDNGTFLLLFDTYLRQS